MKTGIRLLLAAMVLSLPLASQASVFVSVNIAPPPLLVYEQPPIPGPDYIWIPGYWAWDPDWEDYYWVPGTWELAPQPAYYWTPGYWGWVDTVYVWHSGYWGPRVGYYGGIDYGYGYGGHGYEGGRWEHDHFYYNTAVNNVNVTQIHNTYNTTVVNNIHVTRVSYNGGDGGVRDRPRPEEEQAARERHIDPTPEHERHIQTARQNRAQFASHHEGGGDQVIAATPRPAALTQGNVVRAERPKWNPPAEALRNRGDRGDRTDRGDRGDRGDRNDAKPDRDDSPRDVGRNRENDKDAGNRVRDNAQRDSNDRDRGNTERQIHDRDGENTERQLNDRDRGNAERADLDKPLQMERPQSRRHRDRSNPVTTPDSRPVPESQPRELREPVEKSPHFERMRPIPSDDNPVEQPKERPQRMERMERHERPERAPTMGRSIERPSRNDRPERPQMESRGPRPEAVPHNGPMARPQVEREAQAPKQIREERVHERREERGLPGQGRIR